MPGARCLIPVLMVLAGAGSAAAQDVRGYVQEVDATKGVITLATFFMGKVSVRSFSLSKADIPVVNIAGQALKLSDLQTEALVTLKVNTQEEVVSIIAPLPMVHGALTDVDPKKGELVLKLLAGPRTIALAPETKIYSNGAQATLKDLPMGSFIRVTFTQDQKSVVEVKSGKGVFYPQPVKRMAVLIEMDTDKRLARIFTSSLKGDVSKLRDVPLAKDATFSFDYLGRPIRALKIEEITKGFTTYYWVEPVYKRIVHMHIEMPILARREVKALDLENRRLTILDNDVESVLTLSPRLKILSPTGAGKLADIKPGAFVDCGLSPDRQQIEVLVVPSK